MVHKPFLEHDLELARRVHRTLLPRRLVTDDIDVSVRYRENNMLGGDYATVHDYAPGRVLICICDVVGHGVAAALLAGRVNSFVRHSILEVESRNPCEVVNGLNTFIWNGFGGLGVFLTFFCLDIDVRRRRIRYAGCGHPPPLLYRAATGRIRRLRSRYVPIGVVARLPERCEVATASVDPGDRLLIYTDGVIETFGRDGVLFGIDRLEAVLAGTATRRDSADLITETFDALDRFRHGPQTDDVLVVAARIR